MVIWEWCKRHGAWRKMSCTLCVGRDVAKIVHGKLQSINGNLGMVLTTWCMGKGVMYFVFWERCSVNGVW